MSGWYVRHTADYPADWAIIAGRIKARAGRRCEACGRPPEKRNSLGVHHLDSKPGNNADGNLIALCSVCHLRAHHLRPKPQTRENCIERLRTLFEITSGQLCLPLLMGKERS